jgi:porphobilinogen synthase
MNREEQISSSEYLKRRLRRNRKSNAIRNLVQETHLHPSQLVAPLFVLEGSNQKQEVSSMPGIYRFSVDLLIKEAIELFRLGIQAVDLFSVIPKEKKDAQGSESLNCQGVLYKAVKALKNEIPEMCVMVDVALDPYTDHGHDGLIDNRGMVNNDATLAVLGKMCLMAAEAGADIVAPSDMMDGRVAYIRHALDSSGFYETSILSYSAKYASAFYGPFREALHSAPKFGDKKGYQMDPSNAREAILEAYMDSLEGADMLLIKPALPYLDIISKVRQMTHLPLGAYHVSGEYAMVMAAAMNGWLDGPKVMKESLQSIKRAGADFILTYAARMFAEEFKL